MDEIDAASIVTRTYGAVKGLHGFEISGEQFRDPQEVKETKRGESWVVDAEKIIDLLSIGGAIPATGKKTKRSRRSSSVLYDITVDIRATSSADETPGGGVGPDGAPVPTMGVERVVEYKGKGTLQWDPDAGMITKLDLRSEMTMSSVIAMPGFPAEEVGQREIDAGVAKFEYRAELRR